MALYIFLTSLALFFILKGLFSFLFNPIEAMRFSYADENPHLIVIKLLQAVAFVVMSISGLWCIWSII